MFFGMIIVFNIVYLSMHMVLPANAHIRRKLILNEIRPFAKVNISQKRVNLKIRSFVVVSLDLL